MIAADSSALRLYVRIDAVSFRGHYKIVLVKPFDLMRPPGGSHPAPFSQKRRVMVFFFGNFTDLVCEMQGAGKIREAEYTLQVGNATAMDQVPIWHAWFELSDLFFIQCGLAAAAWNTFKPT